MTMNDLRNLSLSFTFSRALSEKTSVAIEIRLILLWLDYLQLVAGSGGDGSAGKAGEEPQEAIPGPVTRFFVIVNRGISNLVQDLILVSNFQWYMIKMG